MILLAMAVPVYFGRHCDRYVWGPDYWNHLGWSDLQDALATATSHNWNIAKNVVLFLGDGMGIVVSTAARVYKEQKRQGNSGEEGYLAWERFPHTSLMKTYTLDQQIPDSAATATAFFSGIKANQYTLGVDNTVFRNDCFVTTTRLTHATPAALYAHSPNRDWECDAKLGRFGHGCRDIAKQLVEDAPGRDVKVMLGGGKFPFGASTGIADKKNCLRVDNRNLTHEWLIQKRAHGHKTEYVQNTQQLLTVDTSKTDHLIGLFSDSHMDYEIDRNRGPSGQPSLANMTSVAIKMLSKSRKKGFFLMVEGGRIDHAMHITEPLRAFEEILAFEDAITTALSMLDLSETLVIVTADHSHVMTINGYVKRGNDILGVSDKPSEIDNMPFTTLMFTNGLGYDYYWNDVREKSTTKHGYKPLSAVPMLYETHSGEDVAAYAIGPMSHLFHRMHEQSYIAHVMGFAACVGPYKKNCARPEHSIP
ncbi:Alkaline phosphatase, tissue-nonspecific isozyme-like 1 [Homarus americanus]|uniref:Alkaline phosphatase n=1 Tax=Homarus americanus TaxID=6706 RepID=A0A8J5MY26_HOMAM|nr:Alkaline phosphatase, tissue-nonspecific isozyme-like 1 [Homarus americanus]